MPLTYDVPVALHAAPPAHVQPGRAHAQFVKGAAKSSPAAKKKPTRKVKNVTIRPGDSVYAIARTHSSSVAAIRLTAPRLPSASTDAPPRKRIEIETKGIE